MCDTSSSSSAASSSTPSSSTPSPRTMKRRSILGAALAGTGVAVAGSIAAAAPADAFNLGTPIVPVLPLGPSQPKGTVLTLLGTAGGPQAEYVRTGTSSVLTVDGFNYVIDAGRSSVTQYLNSGLLFGKLTAMFMTHLHADHLADYYNYFLLEGGQANAEGDRLNVDPKVKPYPVHVYGPGSAGGLPPKPTPTTPTLEPQAPTPGIKDLTDRLNEGYAYSYNLFMRGDGTSLITDLQDIHEIQVPASAGANYNNVAPIMEPFQIYSDEQVKVSAILVPHGKVFPAFAYRFDTAKGSVVFSGDTSAPGFTAETNNVIKLARGADILVHEVINWDVIYAAAKLKGLDTTSEFFTHLRTSHTTTEEVGKVATAAGVPQLALTHLIPSNPKDVPDLLWKAQIAPFYAGKIHVGNDRDQIPLPVRR